MGKRKSSAMRAIEERQRQYRQERRQAERNMGRVAKENTYKFGTGEKGANHLHTAPVHGTTEDGHPVTAAFGLEGTHREGQTYLADGYADDYGNFWGPKDAKQHEDYDGHGGGTQRGKHTGYGS